MTTRTRYFVIVSLLVTSVGLGTGLVAYYVGGLPAGAFASRGGPEELSFIPRDATVIAPGGEQRVEWRDDSVYLTGWAEVLVDGDWVR